MAKSHAMSRCQGYIASVKKGKKKKTKAKKKKKRGGTYRVEKKRGKK